MALRTWFLCAVINVIGAKVYNYFHPCFEWNTHTNQLGYACF